jgi:hypothetical protein
MGASFWKDKNGNVTGDSVLNGISKFRGATGGIPMGLGTPAALGGPQQQPSAPPNLQMQQQPNVQPTPPMQNPFFGG